MKIEKIELDITGMSCTNCSLSVQRTLEKQGLKEVNVDFPNKRATFAYDEKTKIETITPTSVANAQ